MTQPSQFIISSDYASLKNDALVTGIVTVTAGTVVPATVGPTPGFIEVHKDIIISTQGAISRATLSDSLEPGALYPVNTGSWVPAGTVSGVGSNAQYTTYAFTYRINATTQRCQVYITNPYSNPLTTNLTETITFTINTFVPPFA